MISKRSAKAFCREDISLIENYDKAVSDTTQMWHCHHRRETIFSKSDLIEIGEYYNRPACELIFLTSLEHNRLHNLGKCLSAETRRKLSEAKKGKHPSEESRKKISEAKKGKHLSAETRKKMSEARINKPKSAETRKKMSEAHKGTQWFNNGVKSIRAKTCPGPEWKRGRIKKKSSAN